MSAYFITATGTGVGKTFTTCALLHAAKQQGRAARGLKPVISGWDVVDKSNDVWQILEAGRVPPPVGGRLGGGLSELPSSPVSAPPQPSPYRGGSVTAAPSGDADVLEDLLDSISPHRFAAPLSPHRAAVLENKTIDTDALTAWTKQQANTPGLTLIETVGGVMVPLSNDATTLDWMAAAALPVILVTGSYLGTISHTLTALAALRARGIPVAALILNESDGSTVTLAEAEAGLAPFIRDIPLRIVQPRVSSWQEARAIAALIKELA